MGYLVERANLIEKLFKSLHLSLVRVPGALAVATLVTCAVFATATGIVGAVVTLMGLLAFPAMLRAGYSVPLSAGAVTAGGCLGILIPPSVLLIVYGATAGVSVVQLYAGAFFPGIMLAGSVHRLRHHPCEGEAEPRAAAVCRGSLRAAADAADADGRDGRAARGAGADRGVEGPTQPRRAGALPARATVRRAAAVAGVRGRRAAELSHGHERRSGRRRIDAATDGCRFALGRRPQRAQRLAGADRPKVCRNRPRRRAACRSLPAAAASPSRRPAAP